jgi:hypothetical protein
MFEVIVGNIGTVYTGGSYDRAYQNFVTYAERSRDGNGRAAGELVLLLLDGHVVKEYDPGREEAER